ncbi:MAG: hypothetical protein ACLS5G_06910 [Streptococcus sp.]
MLNLIGMNLSSEVESGKDTVKSIVKTYGKASDAEMSGDEMKLNYSGKDYGESVYLNFKKQYDGTFILSYASGRFPQDKVEVDKSYKADWTKEQFDALNKGITLIHQTVRNLKMSLRITQSFKCRIHDFNISSR